MNLTTIFLIVSVAFNLYLAYRVAKVKGRVHRLSRTFDVLARQGKIDSGDVSEASRQASEEMKLNVEMRRTLYGGKQ